MVKGLCKAAVGEEDRPTNRPSPSLFEQGVVVSSTSNNKPSTTTTTTPQGIMLLYLWWLKWWCRWCVAWLCLVIPDRCVWVLIPTLVADLRRLESVGGF